VIYHSPPLDAERFSRIEKDCKVQFSEDLRKSLNECIAFWSSHLAEAEQFKSPLAPHLREPKHGQRKRRQGARKRRQPFFNELALHYEAAGGKPEVKGYDRDAGKVRGFAQFLLEVYDVLPEAARPRAKKGEPPKVETFIRDSELMAKSVADNREAALALGFKDPRLNTPGGSVARAEYTLRMMTAWRR
jgi:hypothetical protein